jgi:UrcA family protein
MVDRIEYFTNRKALRFLAISALALTFSGVGTTSRASGTEDTVPAVKVSFADLDLSQMDGAKKLYRRLDFAARKVCVAMEPSSDADLSRCCIARRGKNRPYDLDRVLPREDRPPVHAVDDGREELTPRH